MITTKDPTYEWELGGRIRAAEFGQRQFAGVVSGPIIDDQEAFRVAADYQESDGFLRNAVTEIDDNFSRFSTVLVDERIPARTQTIQIPRTVGLGLDFGFTL
ncbi:MAG: hypothetical protein AAF219_06100 [Myxococcota bacterium]